MALLLLGAAPGHSAEPSGKTVEEYAKDLESTDRDLKREAAYQLSRPGVDARAALPQLIAALEDSQQQVWFGAVTALAHLGPTAEPALPALMKELEAWEPFRRERQGLQSLVRTAQALGAVRQAAIPSLTNGLTHPKWSVRAGSAMALGFTGDLAVPAIPVLTALLADARVEVRDAAIESLVGLRLPAADSLRQTLTNSSRTPETRSLAATALGRMGRHGVDSIPALRALAMDGTMDSSVRVAALGAIARLARPDSETLGLLLEAWRSGVTSLEQTAARELLLYRPLPEALQAAVKSDLSSRALPTLVRAAGFLAQLGRLSGPLLGDVVSVLESRTETELPSEARDALWRALAGAGPSALPWIWQAASRTSVDRLTTNQWPMAVVRKLGVTSIIPLTEALSHEEATVRALALEGLEAQGEAARLRAQRVAPLLSDREAAVRARAWLAGSRCGLDPEVMSQALPGALEDPDPRVRRAAVSAVSRLGRGALAAVPMLVRELDNSDAEARDAAILAMATLGPDAAEATERLARFVSQGPSAAREKSLMALGGIGPAAGAAVDEIEIVAKSEDASLRRLAAETLGKVKDASKSALPTVLALASDPEAEVRSAAYLALVQIDSAAEGVMARVVSGLEDSDSGVRRAAAEAIGRAGERGRPAETRLFAMLADPAQRGVAREALRSIQPTSVSLLVQALANEEWTVRQMAADALARLGKEAGAAQEMLERLSREDSYEDVKRACRRALRRIREG